MVLPLDQMLRGQGAANKVDGNKDTSLIRLNPAPSSQQLVRVIQIPAQAVVLSWISAG